MDQWISAIWQSNNNSELKSIKFNVSPKGTGTAYFYKDQVASNLFSLEGLEHSPIESILHNAPRNFDPRATKAERDRFTKIHFVAAPIPSSDEIKALGDEWKGYVANGSNSMASTIYEANFDEFELLTGFPFPLELKVIYELGQSNRNFGQFDMLSFDEILQHWRKINEIYERWLLEELVENTDSEADLTLGVYLHTHRVPFASDGDGNYLAYDLIPGKEGRAGQIIAFGLDANIIRWLACSLHEINETHSLGDCVNPNAKKKKQSVNNSNLASKVEIVFIVPLMFYYWLCTVIAVLYIVGAKYLSKMYISAKNILFSSRK